MHSTKIHKVVSIMISLFYRIGFWHRGDKPTVKEIRIKLFHCLYYLLFVLSLMVGSITNKKGDQSIFLAELSMGGGVLATKLWLLIWKQDQIVDLLNRVVIFAIRKDEDYNHFNDKIRGLMKFVVVFVIIVAVCGSSGGVFLSFLGSEKTLFLEIGFPLDYRNNESAFWIATVFIFTEIVLTISIDFFTTIIWYLLMICSSRYEMLGTELKTMGRVYEKGKIKVTERQMQIKYFEDLKASIDSHLQMKKLVSELESFFSDIFFIQFGTSGLCICGSIYYLAFDIGDSLLERILYFSVFVYYIAELFMITYFGNEIKLSSDRLSCSLFESNWYKQPQSTKKCIIIFGEYLKSPQEIVIGKLYPLTLETFTRILNSAYSMFNILKNFQQ